MPHSLRTSRLLLRPPTLRDAVPFAAAVTGKEYTRMTGTWTSPVRPRHARFRFQARADLPINDTVSWLAQYNADIIGSVGLHHRADMTYGLAYWIGAAWWGKGLATEAAGALCQFGFRVLRLKSIMADVFEDNPGSQRVLAKLGFQEDGPVQLSWSAERRSYAPSRAYKLAREDLYR